MFQDCHMPPNPASRTLAYLTLLRQCLSSSALSGPALRGFQLSTKHGHRTIFHAEHAYPTQRHEPWPT